jgi:hypothetical protein
MVGLRLGPMSERTGGGMLFAGCSVLGELSRTAHFGPIGDGSRALKSRFKELCKS